MRRDTAAFQAAEPLLTHDLNAFDTLQTSGSWGTSVGPFELLLTSRKAIPARLARVANASTTIPRAATSGSLHALFERATSPLAFGRPLSPVEVDQCEERSPAVTSSPRFTFKVNDERQPQFTAMRNDVGSDVISTPNPSRLSAWLRLPGRQRVASNGVKASPRPSGSDRALSDRYARDSRIATRSGTDATTLVLRADSASSMTRWAEALSPWLRKEDVTSPHAAPGAADNLQRRPLLHSRSSQFGESKATATAAAAKEISSKRSIADLMEEAGNNARRRRNESGGAELARATVAARRMAAKQSENQESSGETNEPARGSLKHAISNRTTRRRSLALATEHSRPSTSSGVSLKSFVSSRRSSSQSEHRLSSHSSRRASSPMAILNLWQKQIGGSTGDSSEPKSAHDITSRYATVTDSAPSGSLAEIMGSERKHAIHRFAELRRAGALSPSQEVAQDPFDAQSSTSRTTPVLKAPRSCSTLSSSPATPTWPMAFRSPTLSLFPPRDDRPTSESSSSIGPQTPRTPNSMSGGCDATISKRFASFTLKENSDQCGPTTPSAELDSTVKEFFSSATVQKTHAAVSGLPSSTSMPVFCPLDGSPSLSSPDLRLPQRQRLNATESGKSSGGGLRLVRRIGIGKSAAKMGFKLPGSKAGRIDEESRESAEDARSPTLSPRSLISGSPAPEPQNLVGIHGCSPRSQVSIPKVIERIVPPEVIVSKMDAINKLAPEAAAEARRDLLTHEGVSSHGMPDRSVSSLGLCSPTEHSSPPLGLTGLPRSQTVRSMCTGLGISLGEGCEGNESGLDALCQRSLEIRTEVHQRAHSRPRLTVDTFAPMTSPKQSSLEFYQIQANPRGLPAPPRVNKKRSGPLDAKEIDRPESRVAKYAQPLRRSSVVANQTVAFPSPEKGSGSMEADAAMTCTTPTIAPSPMRRRSTWKRHSTFDSASASQFLSVSPCKSSPTKQPVTSSLINGRRNTLLTLGSFDKENDSSSSRRASVQSTRTSFSTSSRRLSYQQHGQRGSVASLSAGAYYGSNGGQSAWRASFGVPAPNVEARRYSRASLCRSITSNLTDDDAFGEEDSVITGCDSSVHEAQIYAVTARLRAVRTGPSAALR